MIAIIVAKDKNRVIGYSGDLPEWRLKSDLEHFKLLTQNNVVIMGRATYESIGRPLPNRKNIVISTSLKNTDGITVVKSYESAMKLAESYAEENCCDVYIIGGQSIYELALSDERVQRLLVTLVNGSFRGDTFFPVTPIEKWRLERYKIYNADANNSHDYAFMEYVARKPGEGYDTVFYYPSSRSEEQTIKMQEIENCGICPFCRDWLEWYHDNPIIYEGDHWVVTKNDNPYENSSVSLLMISKHHCKNFRNLPLSAQLEMGVVINWVENNCGLNFFGFGMRVGSVDKVSGSINHLHAHFIAGDIKDPNHKPVRFKMSNRPKSNKPPENYC